VESKTGAAQNELGAAPVLCLAGGYEVVGSVQVSDCIGLQAATMRGMAECIGACAGRMGSDLFFARVISPFGSMELDTEHRLERVNLLAERTEIGEWDLNLGGWSPWE